RPARGAALGRAGRRRAGQPARRAVPPPGRGGPGGRGLARAAGGGPPAPQAAQPVGVAEHNPAWPQRFVEERERIAAALGDTDAVIEHIGSTPAPPPTPNPGD